MSDLQHQLSMLLADRQSPETRAFYLRLLKYIERRANSVRRNCYADLLSYDEVEEVVGDVLQRLMTGALARFRGESIGELMAFIRTITDRCLWHSAQRKIKERKALEGDGAREAESWFHHGSPDASADHVPDVALSDRDQTFLVNLLRASSKAEYARRSGVSRAAVTQRVQRIRSRIDALRPKEQEAVDAWMHMAARQVLSEGS